MSTDLGRVMPVLKGEYDATVAYTRLDIVTNSGSSYVCLVDNTGQPVTDTTYWQALAIKGEDGKVDGISVGVRNLIPNSSWKLGTKGWTGWGGSATDGFGIINDPTVEHYQGHDWTAVYFGNVTGNNVKDLVGADNIPLKPNTEYTLRVWIRSIVNGPLTYLEEKDTSGNVLNDHAFQVSVNDAEHYQCFIQHFTTSATADHGSLRYRVFSGEDFMASEAMLVEGNTLPTDWQAAPEDVTDYTDMQVTAASDKIQSTVSAVSSEVEADVSQVTQLSGQVSSIIDARDDLVQKAYYDDGSAGTWSGAQGGATVAGPDADWQNVSGHAYVLQSAQRNTYESPTRPTMPGAVYYVSGWLSARYANTCVQAGVIVTLANSSVVWIPALYVPKGQGATYCTGTVTMPAGAAAVRPWVQLGTSSNSSSNFGHLEMVGLRIATSPDNSQMQDAIEASVKDKATTSQVTQLSNQLALTVSKSDLATSLAGYATQAQVTAASDKIQSTVSAVSAKVDSLPAEQYSPKAWTVIEDASHDLNTVTQDGRYWCKATMDNAPESDWAYLFVDSADSSWVMQRWVGNTTAQVYVRMCNSGTWTPWHQVTYW